MDGEPSDRAPAMARWEVASAGLGASQGRRGRLSSPKVQSGAKTALRTEETGDERGNEETGSEWTIGRARFQVAAENDPDSISPLFLIAVSDPTRCGLRSSPAAYRLTNSTVNTRATLSPAMGPPFIPKSDLEI